MVPNARALFTPNQFSGMGVHTCQARPRGVPNDPDETDFGWHVPFLLRGASVFDVSRFTSPVIFRLIDRSNAARAPDLHGKSALIFPVRLIQDLAQSARQVWILKLKTGLSRRGRNHSL